MMENVKHVKVKQLNPIFIAQFHHDQLMANFISWLTFPFTLFWSKPQSWYTVCVLVTQSCLTLCDPMDCRPQSSSVHGLSQARILEWIAIPFSRGSSWPRIEAGSLALQADSLPSEPPGKLNIRLSLLISDIALKDKDYFKNNCNSTVIPKAMRNEPCCAKSLSRVQLFVTPWTVALQAPLSMGILQARILEWVAMPSSRESSQPRDQTQISRIAGGFFTVWATREVRRNEQ